MDKSSETIITDHSKLKISPNPVVRGVLLINGTVSLGIGLIGIVLPLLPTTPFLLLSALCYSKSSKRFHRWLLNNKIFGDYITNYMKGKGISLKAKSLTLLLLWTLILLSAFYFVDILIIQIVLIFISISVTVHILKLPTYSPSDEH